MFSRLPESNARRERRTGGTVVSTVLHFVFIALAVRATSGRATPAPTITPIAAPIYTENRPDPTPPAETRRTSGPASNSASTLPSAPSTPVPTIDLDMQGIAEVGPPVDIFARASDFDPTRIAGSGTATGSPNVSDGSPMPENLVDKPILAIPGTASPRYPSMLQSAGVEGDVRAQFVVDTLGRVEQGSIRVLDMTHDLFGSSVRDALSRARFKPAEAGGRKVRQLAEQVFTFRISK
ncbi:MAG TPA: TonB family protein [Gemmatimonadaceae bacterium]|nr:TonB family protein [Gemmatimonadaceae bacterium]